MAKKHRELIAREGWIFLVPFLILALASLGLGWSWLVTVLALVLAAYVAYFFRNPYRQIPEEPNAVVSPADGRIVAVHSLEDGRQLVSIFLNIFNVHVNRMPIPGEVTRVTHTPGKFLAAYKDEASQLNEQNLVRVRDEDFSVDVIQIAGLIARRIVCWVKESDRVLKGQRLGLIRFGSRVDVILPAECDIVVKPGQKIAGGSDILAIRTTSS